MNKVVIASNNPGKLRELAALLAPLGIEALPQSDFRVTEAEMAAHRQRIAALGPNAVWLAYVGDDPRVSAASG